MIQTYLYKIKIEGRLFKSGGSCFFQSFTDFVLINSVSSVMSAAMQSFVPG
jgi:hypothetical protein